MSYDEFGTYVELDGRAFHDNAAARARDAERDLAAAAENDSVTVRLSYGQVFRSACSTAAQIGTLLVRRGWPGPFVNCGNCPETADGG